MRRQLDLRARDEGSNGNGEVGGGANRVVRGGQREGLGIV